MDLYNNVSYCTSKIVTRNYSTSFSLGIGALDKAFRNPIYAIYGYVRLADEIVDSFMQYDRETLFNDFVLETKKALCIGISTNPVINAFVDTVNNYSIDIELIDAFLESMRMDLSNTYYERTLYDTYIYGSAEVVGLMCLKVFVQGNEEEYLKLRKQAQALGSAFQKVNFLRDIKSDIDDRSRIYLPGVNSVTGIDEAGKKHLEDEIVKEFELALEGIKLLPEQVRLGVYSAYLYYTDLFSKIQGKKVSELLKTRVSVPNWKKLLLFIKSLLDTKVLKTC